MLCCLSSPWVSVVNILREKTHASIVRIPPHTIDIQVEFLVETSYFPQNHQDLNAMEFLSVPSIGVRPGRLFEDGDISLCSIMS